MCGAVIENQSELNMTTAVPTSIRIEDGCCDVVWFFGLSWAPRTREPVLKLCLALASRCGREKTTKHALVKLGISER